MPGRRKFAQRLSVIRAWSFLVRVWTVYTPLVIVLEVYGGIELFLSGFLVDGADVSDAELIATSRLLVVAGT